LYPAARVPVRFVVDTIDKVADDEGVNIVAEADVTIMV